jgi:hypothetical protein
MSVVQCGQCEGNGTVLGDSAVAVEVMGTLMHQTHPQNADNAMAKGSSSVTSVKDAMDQGGYCPNH